MIVFTKDFLGKFFSRDNNRISPAHESKTSFNYLNEEIGSFVAGPKLIIFFPGNICLFYFYNPLHGCVISGNFNKSIPHFHFSPQLFSC